MRSGAMRSGGSGSCKGLECLRVSSAQPLKAPMKAEAPARVRKCRRAMDEVISRTLFRTIFQKTFHVAIRFARPIRPCTSRFVSHKEQRRTAMARMVVIYRKPADVKAFERHYFETHIPLAKKIPGLRKYEVSRGPIAVLA